MFELFLRIQTSGDIKDTDRLITGQDWLILKSFRQGGSCSNLQPAHTLFKQLCARKSDTHNLSLPCPSLRWNTNSKGREDEVNPVVFDFYLCSWDMNDKRDPHPNHLHPLVTHSSLPTQQEPASHLCIWNTKKTKKKPFKQMFTFSKCSPERRSWLHIWCVCHQQSRCCTWRAPLHHSLQTCL